MMASERRTLGHNIAGRLRRMELQVLSQLELRIKLAAKRIGEQSLLVEKQHADRSIHNILPATTVKELTETGNVQLRFLQSVTIESTELVGFTKKAEKFATSALIDELNVFFSKADWIAERQNIEKIKTIGVSYICGSELIEAEKGPSSSCMPCCAWNMCIFKEAEYQV